MSQPSNPISFEGLSVAERILLVEQIWDSIAAEQEAIELTDAQKEELDRRVAAYEKDPSAGVTWEEIKAATQNKK
jgi:putative addiction module component (TIGR02574 family)